MLTTIRKIARQGRGNEFLWRYAFNFGASVNYHLGTPRLTPEQRDIVGQLNRDGIAITSIEKCAPGLLHFDELDKCVNEMLADRRQELDDLRTKAADGSIGEKTFMVELLGSPLQFDAECVYAKFALQHFLTDIANAYFRMVAELRYYNVWNTFATSGEARESQLWHFDREDNFILKAFLYLNDVDEEAGPFTYAPGTHRKGRRWNQLPEYFFENNVKRSRDDQMSKVVPESDWIRATGKKGTLVLADTRGFHKGGEARSKDRLMYTCMYTSPASQSKRLLLQSPSASVN